jgi:ppGpp synthetase/RelA/SpoT-type nucleotidyltranferase
VLGMTEATLRPGSNPLAASYLKAAAKEIEQTAVAVGVVGTRSWKLKQMAALVEPMVEALVGERPEVVKTRGRLKRLVHNARVSVTDARQASAALNGLADGVREVQRLVSKGVGNAEPMISASGVELANTWGYSASEARDALRALERANRALESVGLLTATGDFAELNPGRVKGAGFVEYDADSDMLVFDLGKSRSLAENTQNVLQALGERLWRQEFRSRDREPWGDGKRGLAAFSEAFAGMLSGRRLAEGMTARLSTTVGQMASRWPENGVVQASLEPDWIDRLLQEIVHPLGYVSDRKTGPYVKTRLKPPLWKPIKGSWKALHVKEPDKKRRAKIKSGLQDAIGNLEKHIDELAPGMSVQDHVNLAVKRKKAEGERFKGFVRDLEEMSGYRVTGRVKAIESLLGKLTRKDDKGKLKYKGKNADVFGDVTGTRITVNSVNEVYDAVQKIVKNAADKGMKVSIPDDKIKNPQGGLKYRSVHLDITDRDGRKKELQIRTVRQDMAANWGHDIYKPLTAEQRKTLAKHADELVEYGAAISDHYFDLDNGRESEPPPCPKVAARFFGCLT